MIRFISRITARLQSWLFRVEERARNRRLRRG